MISYTRLYFNTKERKRDDPKEILVKSTKQELYINTLKQLFYFSFVTGYEGGFAQLLICHSSVKEKAFLCMTESGVFVHGRVWFSLRPFQNFIYSFILSGDE